MDVFLSIISSYPTARFTAWLTVSVAYWLIAMTGLAGDTADGGDSLGDATGLLSRLGLGGVPLTIVLSLMALLGWLCCYFMVLLALPLMPGSFSTLLLGSLIAVAAFVVGTFLTALVLRPVRRLLHRASGGHAPKVLAGRSGVVRSSTVTAAYGHASIDDGGAGLILQVRTSGEELPLGSRIVLIEQLPGSDAWRVVSEHEFRGL